LDRVWQRQPAVIGSRLRDDRHTYGRSARRLMDCRRQRRGHQASSATLKAYRNSKKESV